MPAARLRGFLDARGVRYVSVQHSPAFTAPEVAESSHIPRGSFAKTVMVKIDQDMAMIVVPANRKVKLSDLREMLGMEKARLASEAEFNACFPDCDLGAMPPFGNLYGIPVYLDAMLAHRDEIAFNAGSHHEVFRMSTQDYLELVRPIVLDLITA